MPGDHPSFLCSPSSPSTPCRTAPSAPLSTPGCAASARGGVGPKELTLWPTLWTHHRELGDGGPLVLPVTDPVGEEEQGEEP